MKLSSAIGGGIAGAITLTLIHETVRKFITDAPRMDLLGMEAIAKTLDSADAEIPEEDKLFKITMAGDIISNSLYYSLIGIGKGHQAILRGALLGLAAGVGAVYLPKPLELNTAPAGRTLQTKIMTFALYTIGGVVAGFIGQLIEDKRHVL
jgi:hypothetical protein